MDRYQVAAVVPAFNEAETISNVVMSLLPLLHVIVVNDNSSDKTAQLALAAGATVVSNHINLGYDSSLEAGFKAAHEMGMSKVITFDADGQHPVSEVPLFIDKLTEYDVVVGRRQNTARWAEALFAHVAKWMWGIDDPLCGMKGYKVTAYLKNSGFDSCNSIGTELAIQSQRRGLKLFNIPLLVEEREFGKPRFGQYFKANVIILKALIRVLCKRV
ncbi:glycosyltransferase family 2 protein [Psychrobium sp. nBUS_13]|uniref:glycosyltransferase family 2 protein n=1 Tax=Psychrobium sp. nBUS_13 TaxID=3395319 RepID=UPI003EBE2986